MNLRETPPVALGLAVFVALFLMLGLGYSTLTPIFENSDETLHYPYVKHLADGQGLPLARPGQLWNQEGTQPPLYYAIVAATTFWIDTDNLAEHLQRNPHWLFTEVRALINDNQNLVLHGPADTFPYRRATLAIHIGRWWSLTFGLLMVICTFLIARHLFPNNLPLTLTATALTALNPQFIRVSATVSNDSLSAALTALTVLLALKFTQPFSFGPEGRGIGILSRTQRTEHLNPKEGQREILQLAAGGGYFGNYQALLLGLLAGLALLTKLSSLTALLLVAFLIFWRLFFLGELHQAPFSKMIRWLIIIGGVTAILTSWWFWRNYQLYGEWLATETHLNLAGRGSLTLPEVWSLRAEIERAYWATFGWGQLRPPEWIYQFLFWLTRVGLIGLILALLAKLVQGEKSKPLPLNLREISFEKIIPLFLWVALNLALYLRWVIEVGSVSHTRLIFPALPAISLLLALGWHALLPSRLAGWFSGVIMMGFLVLNIYSLGWLIYPAFRLSEPTQGERTRDESISNGASPIADSLSRQTVDLTFLDRLKLINGRIYPQNQNLAPVITQPQAMAGDTVMVETQWQVLASLDKNYSVAAVLLAPDGQVLARRETYPGLGLRPTRYLQPNSSFLDVYPLKLTADVPEPIVARATVNLFDFDSETRAGFPALDPAGQEVMPVVGLIKVVPRVWPRYWPTYSTQVNFGDTITLIGYDLDPTPLAAGQGRRLILYWESLAPVSEDYVVFLHLLDAKGQLLTQADAPPTNNAYPTSWWAAGEVVADPHLLPVAPDSMAVRLGLYQLDSGQRLPILSSILPDQDNAVEIRLP